MLAVLAVLNTQSICRCRCSFLSAFVVIPRPVIVLVAAAVSVPAVFVRPPPPPLLLLRRLPPEAIASVVTTDYLTSVTLLFGVTGDPHVTGTVFYR